MKPGQRVTFKLKNEHKTMVGIPIIIWKQFLGILFPGEILDESFVVHEGVHPGIHAYDNFHITEEPTAKKEGYANLYSYYTGEELEKLMKDA